MTDTVIYDNVGKPSLMVRVPKFRVCDVIPGGSEATHPAFIVDGKEVPEIYVAKYQAIIVKDRAYSLPFQQPAVEVDFDQARAACEAKGQGWHLLTNAEWAAIALWAKKNGTLPHGNNDYGTDHEHEDENGVSFDGLKALTGSGPETWAHDHTKNGIFDLNGNVWEWVSGLRLMDGEIQVIPDNNAVQHIDLSPESSEWLPLMVGDKTLKYTETEDGLKITTGKVKGTWESCNFTDLQADMEIPSILKELALFPADDEPMTDYFWAMLKGERLPIRGGSWSDGAYAGVFALSLFNPRFYSFNHIGFRPAFVNLESATL